MKKPSQVVGVVGVLLGVAVVASGIVLGQPALWERQAAKPADPGPSLGQGARGAGGGVPPAAKPSDPGPAIDQPEPPGSVKATSFKPPPVAFPASRGPMKVSGPESVAPARFLPPELPPSDLSGRPASRQEPAVPARFVPPEPVVPARFVAPEPAPSDLPSQPAGRQEPAVSIEWIGPPVARLHHPVPFQLIVKNTSTFPVEQTIVRQHVPAGVTVKMTEPRALAQGDTLSWELGTLQPHEQKCLAIHLVPESKGRVACRAQVSFTSSTATQFQVQEPKLMLKASAPERVQLGETTNVTLTVTNPGDGPADHVRVHTLLSDGLETARGRQMDFDLGNLGPNETRSVQVACAARNGGEQKCEAVASAEGDLVSRDTTVLHVVQPKLDLKIVGPHLRFLDRPATYTFKVTNPGEALANNVTLSEQLPQGFKFVTASAGGRLDFATQTVSWFLGDLGPNTSREVTLQAMAVNTGDFQHTAVARSAQGLQTEAVADTRVEGLSALQVELTDLEDPVEVGANTRYEIRVTNSGSKPESNIQVVCTLPDKMELWGAEGAGNCRHRVDAKELIFDPLPSLAPRSEAVYHVNVRAVAAGDVRFRVRVKGDSLEEPVTKEESTRVYRDEVTPK